jgi:hypothetical protein
MTLNIKEASKAIYAATSDTFWLVSLAAIRSSIQFKISFSTQPAAILILQLL